MGCFKRYIAGAVAAGLLLAGSASAQCILSNPSFEISGSGGAVFGGWNQFGNIGVTTTNVPHGAMAARVTGPNTGSLGVSGYWQRLDSQPGDQWNAVVCAWHTPTSPLTGDSRAILNIEWRDAGENLISYESYDVLTPATPTDEVVYFTVTSGAAPTGTASTRLLLAVLQGATDPTPDVYFDAANIYEVGPPSQEDIQWNDFPGGTTVNFSGYTWRVKGPGYYGPGPNLFNNSTSSVWVTSDQLHVSVKNISGNWYSSEVVLEDALGYGDYIFTTEGRLDLLDPNVVLGIFLWEYGPCWDPSYLWWNPYNEIDVEFSRWADPMSDIGQFVAQPFDWGGNISRFDYTFSNGELTSHAFKWLPDRVEYRSWTGGPNDESPVNYIHTWTYTGPHIPRPEQPRVHINLWKLSSDPSGDQVAMFDEFTFVPECFLPHCDPNATAVPDTPPGPLTTRHLYDATPNPFNPSTTIRFVLERAGFAELAVYDVAGRRIRTLVSDSMSAGEHRVDWNGRDDGGRSVASGVYLVQLRSSDFVETSKMVLLK